MARGPRYSVPFRRRREGKTNYGLRRRLIISRRPRLVVRGSLKHVTVQLVSAEIVGDKVITSAHSKELARDYSWKGDCGNIPAAYLTGLLCGYRAASKGVKQAVLDIDMHSPSKGSRVFGALKGFIDAGIEVPHDEEILPDEQRIEGRHIADYAARIASSDKELYSRMFSRYLAASLAPEEIPKHFAEVKEKIISSFE
ncbi:MAG: 50S ribosomal protein L18 [Candidatus Bathyarchaeia archaeon]